AYVYVPPETTVVAAVRDALAQRHQARCDRVEVELVVAAPTFLAGQETAAAAAISGRPTLPRLPMPPVYVAGVRDLPTLVQNVETLAHIALIARYGAGWFRTAGTGDEPGTMLFSVVGAVARPGVVERGIGIPLGGVLLGGYHGTWLGPHALTGLELSR